MILSRAQLEDIGAAVINDFCGSIDGQFSAIDIDRLASDYLKLHVSLPGFRKTEVSAGSPLTQIQNFVWIAAGM